MSRFALIACLLIGGCAVRDLGAAIGERSAAIVAGQSDLGHPAVGYLTASGKVHCTATLIAPDTVLAAAHCLKLPALDFVLGPQKSSVAKFWAHPSYAPGSPGHLPESFDLGVLRLKEPIYTVTPLPLALTPPRIGERITIVGFGRTANGADDAGEKRQAESVITRVLGHTFWFGQGSGKPPTICLGDSGGPSLVLREGVEELVGVHSATEGEPFACQGIGFDVRVDVFTAWIDDPERKPEALAFGEPCSRNDSCASGRCIGAPHFACSEACVNAGASCAGGAACLEVELADGKREPSCLPRTGGVRSLGQRCDGAGQCADGTVCLAFAVGEGRCRDFCDRGAATSSCASGQSCKDDDFGFASLCVPDVGWSPDPTSLGGLCAGDADCASGLCRALPVEEAKRCTQSCAAGQSAGCPAGFSCEPSSEASGQCVATTGAPFGASCARDGDCADGLCRESSPGTSICTRPCGVAASQSCGSEAICSTVGARRVCLPASSGCTVTAQAGTRATLVWLVSGLGLFLLGLRRWRDRQR